VVNGLTGKAGQVSVRFLDGEKKSIKVKDLNTTKDYQKVYVPGKVIRVAVNKLERLCTKEKVIEACLVQAGKSSEADMQALTSAFAGQFARSIAKPIGQEVQAEIQLVKDYGLIAQIDLGTYKTGFILNDHKLGTKYKQGQTLTCRVLDLDPAKQIADLKEIAKSSTKETKVSAGQKLKGIVELNKVGYMIVSVKTNRATLGVCLNSNFNQDQDKADGLEIGEEIEVKAGQWNKAGGFYELTRIVKEEPKKRTANTIELKEGTKFMGQIKSIKQQWLYVQLPKVGSSSKAVNIGRLHMIECKSTQEFNSFAVGDRIEAKILKVVQDSQRTWIELTRGEKHMAKL